MDLISLDKSIGDAIEGLKGTASSTKEFVDKIESLADLAQVSLIVALVALGLLVLNTTIMIFLLKKISRNS